MAKFRKVIGRPGVFRIDTPSGKELKPLTATFWKNVHKTAKDMLAAGLRIPSPYAHRDEQGIVPSPVDMQDNEEVDFKTLQKKKWSSDINAGFWEDFEIDKKGQFIGIVDVPGELEDLNSPAGKLRKTIKETSVFIEPEFTDGKGRTWKNALRHVALVTNPVDPDQSNFELISNPDDYALAMAFSMADEVGGDPPKPTEPKDTTDVNAEDTTTDPTSDETSSVAANIPEIVSLLKDKLGYEMPSDTDEKNFLDRLRTILVSIKEDAQPDEEMKDLEKKPKEAETESSTVIMANEDTNPDNVVFINKINKLVAKQIEDLKEDFKQRIKTLIAAGKITKKYAEAELLPAIGTISMSHEDLDADGNLPRHWLEMSISAMEGRSGLTDVGELLDEIEGSAEPHDDEVPAMTSDEANAIYNSVL